MFPIIPLRRLRSSKRVAALVARVVEASHQPLLDRALSGALGLSAGQAKGYIRAWSRGIVRRQVAIAVPVSAPFEAQLRDELTVRATRDVVNRVYWEAMRARAARGTAQRRAA
ncbi:MAG: hypothetical protein R3C10_12530 [Pirellulales bacterium]|nr:hypothetical protein [Planctomycetales bacterium]